MSDDGSVFLRLKPDRRQQPRSEVPAEPASTPPRAPTQVPRSRPAAESIARLSAQVHLIAR